HLTSLPTCMFEGFTGSVSLHEGIKVIGDNCFKGSSIKEITLPASLNSIGNSGFYNCTKLETLVSLNPIPPTLGITVFTGVNKTTCKLYVPKGSVELYQAAAQWKDFLIEEYNVSLIDNLIFKKSTGENLYQVKTGENFDISVYANLMSDVRLGLYYSNGIFAEDIVASINNNTYTSQVSTNQVSGSYIIQPYIVEEGEKKVVSRKTGSHIIDRLLITVKNNWDEFSLRSAKAELNNHILVSTGQEDLLEVATGNIFKVLVRYANPTSAIKIGLFDPITGVLVSDITQSVDGNIFSCKVPTALADAKYNLIPYQVIAGNNVYVERLTEKAFLVDRLPLFVTLGEDTEEPEIPRPATIDLVYSEDGGVTVLGEYKGVRVGEYYWMNTNFNNPTDIPVTKAQIDYAHDTYGMFNKQSTSPDSRTYWNYLGEQMGIPNPTESQITTVLLPEFQKYYGTYYTMNRDRINKLSYVRRFGSIKEKINGTLVGQDIVNHYWDGIRSVVQTKYWDLPTAADVLQLIGMCGHGTMPEVRQYLSFKEKEVPVAIVAPGMDWFYPNSIHFPTPTYPTDVFDSSNTNKYGMNIVPNGFRWGVQKNSLTVKNEGGFVTLTNVAVDELVGAGLNQALTLPIIDKDKDALNIESRIFTSFQLGDHPVISYGQYPSADAIPMRWCRALSDEELGYKLYINQDMSGVNYPASAMVIYAAMVGEQYANRKRSGEEVLLEKVRLGRVNKADISIIKLGLNESAPSGYNELPRGYIRGFYVQYILDNPSPRKTVSDLIDIAQVNPFLWIAGISAADPEFRVAKAETLEDSPVSIYPNPVSDNLYLNSDKAVSEVQIYSTNGKMVFKQANVGSSINVGHLAGGTYVLKLQIEGKIYTHKMIKK
ncbi:putative secreted protein (Por secretion system target), partial [Dysgonomonas alginatilytica]